MADEFDMPMFAFHDLNYIPYGFGSSEAPYIETPAATMRAAATLMRLGLGAGSEEGTSIHEETEEGTTVVCDLGCGDGEFRKTTELFPMFHSYSCTPSMPRYKYSETA
jgi:hypothetical protein